MAMRVTRSFRRNWYATKTMAASTALGQFGMGCTSEQGKNTEKQKMSERRKSSKPIMEKRRRERINSSLNELKNLLLETRKKDSTFCSKLEKADILEMTVQHLKSIRSHQEKASTTNDPIALAHYRAGFNHSAMEISRHLIDSQDIEVKVRTRLLTHLSNSCHAVLSNQASKQVYPPMYHIPQSSQLTAPIHKSTSTSSFSPHEIQLPTFIPREPYFNPAQLRPIPGTLTNGKLPAILTPSPNIALPQPQVLPAQENRQEPGSSTITHDQEPLASPNDTSSNQNNNNSNNSTSTQTSASNGASVWRPWS